MQQWEYLVVERGFGDTSETIYTVVWRANGQPCGDLVDHRLINQWGAEGWELIETLSNNGATSGFLFKRPK